MQIQIRSYWSRAGPSSKVTGVLIRKGDETWRQTQRLMPRENTAMRRKETM